MLMRNARMAIAAATRTAVESGSGTFSRLRKGEAISNPSSVRAGVVCEIA